MTQNRISVHKNHKESRIIGRKERNEKSRSAEARNGDGSMGPKKNDKKIKPRGRKKIFS